ncbi:bleomycin resistance protein [Chromatiales bacterium (ex Bugula neritina AB1)]|nr:bleomycin resistance protein [Chromatiales bacterium (ex Bugula neritina AB1)]
MHAHFVNPILNVSNMQESFEWFTRLGWKTGFQWGEPLSFGSVISGDVQLFLCLNAQGGRGKGANTETFGETGDESADKGVWMSLWVDDVDEIYKHCLANNIEITFEPADMPWGVREMHLRHPDGHIFRVSRSTVD